MFNISNYLEKFKNIGHGERQMKEAVILSVKEITGLTLEGKCVQIKNGEVFLVGSPGVKNAIFIKKAQILAKIKEKTDKPLIDLR